MMFRCSLSPQPLSRTLIIEKYLRRLSVCLVLVCCVQKFSDLKVGPVCEIIDRSPNNRISFHCTKAMHYNRDFIYCWTSILLLFTIELSQILFELRAERAQTMNIHFWIRSIVSFSLTCCQNLAFCLATSDQPFQTAVKPPSQTLWPRHDPNLGDCFMCIYTKTSTLLMQAKIQRCIWRFLLLVCKRNLLIHHNYFEKSFVR